MFGFHACELPQIPPHCQTGNPSSTSLASTEFLYPSPNCDLKESHSSGEELEHEIAREALGVAPHLLVEALGGYAVEHGEIGIQEHLVASNQEDAILDALYRNCDRLHEVLCPASPRQTYSWKCIMPSSMGDW